MQESGSRRPHWGVWWWGLLVLLSLSGSPLSAAPTASPSSSESIERSLLTLLANCETLRGVLQKQAGDLQTSAALLQQLKEQLADSALQIADLQQRLTSSQESAATSAAAIARLSDLLTQSQSSLAGLSLQFEVYKTAESRRLRSWQIGAVGSAVAAIIAVIVAVLK
jgi:uncharacterized phage infection (PIP) family protein YhgE